MIIALTNMPVYFTFIELRMPTPARRYRSVSFGEHNKKLYRAFQPGKNVTTEMLLLKVFDLKIIIVVPSSEV